MTVLIRERTVADIPDLVDIIGRVHEQDRYPIFLPDGDVERFITRPKSVASWVAVDDAGNVVGHVALNAETSKPVMELVDDMAGSAPALYVSRLFVDPSHRGTGAGHALLESAWLAAVSSGHCAALDVVEIPTAAQAIALYRRAGWNEIGRVTFDLADLELTELVFLGPQGPS